MKLIDSVTAIRDQAREWRRQGRRIGLVPTMGALHPGHLSLVESCHRHTDATVVSIFVNPLQFGPGEDLERYPRDLDGDLQKLRGLKVDAVFATSREQMYPAGFQTHVTPGLLAEPLCGKSRRGHFLGVTTIVTKLFNLVQPQESFFGQKDYQQARVLSQLVEDLNLDHRLRILPTVREADGLAYSSRNLLLDADERRAAPRLHAALEEVERTFAAGTRDQKQLRNAGVDLLAREPKFRLDYFEIRDDKMLEDLPVLGEAAVAAAAVFLGKTRLIDNILLGTAKRRLG